MKQSIKQIARRVLGIILVLAGLIGVVIPVIPGWPLLIPGALLLGFDIPRLVRILEQGAARFPRHQHRFYKVRDLLHQLHKKDGAASE